MKSFQLEPGESKDIYMPIVPVKTLMRGELKFHVSATAFLAKDDYYGSMQVIVSCFPSWHLSYRVVVQYGMSIKYCLFCCRVMI